MTEGLSPRVLSTLDHPPRVLFWSIDEFMVFVGPVVLGMCVGSLLLMLSGFVLRPFYRKSRRRFPPGALKSWIYWNFPGSVLKRVGLITNFPPSHVRELLL